MLPELAVAEAWLLAMLFVERARAFMIFPTFVLITSRSALKSAFQVIAAQRLVSLNLNPHPNAMPCALHDIGGTGPPAETVRSSSRSCGGRQGAARACRRFGPSFARLEPGWRC